MVDLLISNYCTGFFISNSLYIKVTFSVKFLKTTLIQINILCKLSTTQKYVEICFTHLFIRNSIEYWQEMLRSTIIY